MMTRIAAAALMLLGMVGMTTQADDKSPPAAPKYRIEKVTPDAGKNEINKINEYVGTTLVRSTIEYKDDSIKCEEFRVDGTKAGLIEWSKSGLKTTSFNEKGTGLKTITEVTKGQIDVQEFREDGKTLLSKSLSNGTGRQSEYYGKDGKLILRRVYEKAGNMIVTVFDANGKELYKQTWLPGIAGYVLQSVTEKTPTGSRTLHFLGKDVQHADLYKPDGSFEKKEQGDKLSTPFEQKRAQEFDAANDPTAPKSRQK